MSTTRARHVALLGDSTIDNELYVEDGVPVAEHLRSVIGAGHRVTMLAVDGHRAQDVLRDQLPRLQRDTTHLVLSVGGNDALQYIDVLRQPVGTVAEGIAQLGRGVQDFEASYLELLDAVLAHDLPTTVCTIYNGDFPLDAERHVIRTAVRLFNDVIPQTAVTRSLPVIELRQVCSVPEDYYDPIEPNDRGGRKIAEAIAGALAAA